MQKPRKNKKPKRTKLQTPLGLLCDSVDMWSAVLVVSCLAFPGSPSMGLIFCIFVGLPKNPKQKIEKDQTRVSCLASPGSPSMSLNLLDLCLLSNLAWVPLHGSDLFFWLVC